MSADLHTDPEPHCVRCFQPIRDRELVVYKRDEFSHVRCRLEPERAPAKCVRCSGKIIDRELVYFDQGDLIHLQCWRISESEARIRESKELSRVSRQLIDDVRAARRERTKPDGGPEVEPH